jgi:hypothetical protein
LSHEVNFNKFLGFATGVKIELFYKLKDQYRGVLKILTYPESGQEFWNISASADEEQKGRFFSAVAALLNHLPDFRFCSSWKQVAV